MRRIITFLLISTMLAACTSSKKHLASGNYEMAMYKAVKKLKRKKTKEKQVLVLEEAYKKANERDNDQIAFLKKEGQPDSWDRIYEIYSGMKGRQEMVRPLLPLRTGGRTANFQLLNYDEEIIKAKQNAAEYSYALAMQLLQKGGKENARKAYYELQQVKRFYSNFKDVDEQTRKCLSLGMSYAVFKMQNKTRIPLPAAFEDELTKISVSELDNEWIRYHSKEDKNLKYDYTILLNMKAIDVSPELVKENRYTESKEIPDGWDYFLDRSGNVMKDSLGNDIKKAKYKTIACNVQEIHQSKRTMIRGSLDYINNSNGQLIKTAPVTAESIFDNFAATATGDLNALKPETKARLGKGPLPFPPTPEMILNAGQSLKNMVKDIIWQQKGLLY